MNVQFLYLDESADGGWTSAYGGNSPYRYFIYAGVIVDGEQNHRFNQGVTEVINDHFNTWLPRPDEIHYADICRGKGRYGQLDKDERQSLRDDIFELILEVEPELMATVVDKDRMKERYGEKAHTPKKYGFRSIIERYHKHLKENDCIGTVTIDMGESSFDTRLRDLIYKAQSHGIKLPGVSSNRDTTLPRLMDTVTVSPSEMSAGIQIADVVAYQVHVRYNHGPPAHGYDVLKPLFRDPSNSYFTEPSVIPK